MCSIIMLNFCNYAINFLIHLFILVISLEHVFTIVCIMINNMFMEESFDGYDMFICAY